MGHDLKGFATRLVVALQLGFLIQWRRRSTDGIISRHRHLHETITRNHRCKSLDELLELAYNWFENNNNYYLDMRNTFANAA